MSDGRLLEVATPTGSARAVVRFEAGDGRDQVATALERGGWSSFEAPLPAWIVHAVRQRPGLFVDVGANTGYYTLLALAVSARVRTIAIEPLADLRAHLARNVRANGLGHRVEVVAAALSDHDGMAPLYVPSQEHGLIETSASLEYHFKPAHSRVEEVRLVRLDRLLRRPSLLFRRVRVIKIDVEGHEAAVLAGATRIIRRDRPVIFVEILPGADTTRMRTIVEQHDYADLALRPDGPVDNGVEVQQDGQAWNHAFVPRERVASMMAVPLA